MKYLDFQIEEPRDIYFDIKSRRSSSNTLNVRYFVLLDSQFSFIVTSDLIVCLWRKTFLIIINTVSYRVSSESLIREKVKLWLKDAISKRRLNNSSNSNKQQNNHSSWNLWYINFGDISLLCFAFSKYHLYN